VSDQAAALRTELLQRFDHGADAPLDDDAFERLAGAVFRRNYEAVAPYGAYCRARGITPDTLGDWRDIPAVPTAAFKELALRVDARTARVFRTSGTTRGRERRGEHHVVDLELYRASLRATFRAYLLPDDAELRFLSLMPPAESLPDSSLAFMIDDVVAAFGDPGSRSFADADGVAFGALEAAVESAVDEDRPVLLLGTSAAFVHWLDRLGERGRGWTLPAGSRLMDTGGYKGRGRAVDPAELEALYGRRLGLPAVACVNEYGMTEMLSQLYDSGLRDRHLGRTGPRRKRGPAWVRSVAVDPETLAPLPPGETGLLRHLDLANLDSVAAIQTEDLGRVDAHGLVLEGRAAGAPPRGCSIAMDLLLEGPE
jgi:hypothetical protein